MNTLAALICEEVAEAMVSLPSRCSRLWIALSGGCDSVVLLHAAWQVRARLKMQQPDRSWPKLYALHVNHHLQAAASHFEHSCGVLCHSLGVPLHVRHLDLLAQDTGHSQRADHQGTGNIEALARDARYRAFAQQLHTGDVLWMAHHADDQAETVLQRVLRGSGTAGMSGIPYARPLGLGRLERPLLRQARQVLEAYARQHALNWCSDPSNANCQYDRNYLRHEVVPRLKARWPKMLGAFAQVAEHAREAHQLLNTMADRQLALWSGAPHRLPVSALRLMGESEARLIIRRALSVQQATMPPRRRLAALMQQLSAEHGHIEWPGGEARLWQGELYLSAVSADIPPEGKLACYLRAPGGKVVAPVLHRRQGGERLCIDGHRRSLKWLFQKYRVPPWLREQYRVAWWQEAPVALLSLENAILSDGWQRVSVLK